MRTNNKVKRISLRVSDDEKRVIKEAAKLANVSISLYILSAVLKQVKLDLEQNNVYLLNNEERDSLIKILACPPKPYETLVDMFKC